MSGGRIYITAMVDADGSQWIKDFVEYVKNHKDPRVNVLIRGRCQVHWIAPSDDRAENFKSGCRVQDSDAGEVHPPFIKFGVLVRDCIDPIDGHQGMRLPKIAIAVEFLAARS